LNNGISGWTLGGGGDDSGANDTQPAPPGSRNVIPTVNASCSIRLAKNADKKHRFAAEKKFSPTGSVTITT